jgi:hypothetical protein
MRGRNNNNNKIKMIKIQKYSTKVRTVSPSGQWSRGMEGGRGTTAA